MTVVHLVPAMEQGGVESVVCDLNRAAAAAGWRSVVISKGGRLAERIAADGGRHVAMDIKSKNPLTYFSRAMKLRRKLREIASLEIDLLCLGLGPNATVGIRLLGASLLINGMERAASRKNGSKRKDLENPYHAH